MQDLLKEIAIKVTATDAKVATAESCSGGLLAHSLTSTPGASEWYPGGIVAYTRESKIRNLGLTENDLAEGLVSQQCAEAMAVHARKLSHADFGISTTGVCGPASSEGHNPCAAWIAVSSERGLLTEHFTAPDLGREKNKEQVTRAALTLLLKALEQ